MPYVSSGYLKIGGRLIPPGEVVHAEKWATRRALLSQGRIKFVKDEDVDTAIEEIDALPKKAPPGMDATELEAALKGPVEIPDPTEYSVKNLRETIFDIKDADVLKKMLKIEEKEKARKTAISVLKDKISSLET